MGNKQNTPLRPDSLLGEFTKASESRISGTSIERDSHNAADCIGSQIAKLLKACPLGDDSSSMHVSSWRVPGSSRGAVA